MPRFSPEFAAMLSDLHARIARVVEVAREEGRAHGLDEIRSLVGGGAAASPVRRGPGRPRGSRNLASAAAAPAAGPKKRRKNSWSGLTPEQRLARVNAIRKGKGLPPKSA
jgi:hypothetical protein